jgi:membrane protease YdiL (CAAX protease family)
MLFAAKRSLDKQLVAILVLGALAFAISQAAHIRLDLHATWRLLGLGVLGAALMGVGDVLTAAIHRVVCGKKYFTDNLPSLHYYFGHTRGLAILGCGGVAAAEELLFRGVIQPWMGIVAGVVSFTILHLNRRMLPVGPWAATEAVWLGLLYQFTGSPIPPMIAHFLHDVVGVIAVQHATKRVDANLAASA